MSGFKPIKPPKDAEVFELPKNVKVGAEIRIEKIPDEDKLKAILMKAFKAGYQSDNMYQLGKEQEMFFQHDFLIAFFSEEEVCGSCGNVWAEPCWCDRGDTACVGKLERWQYHAQQLAITEERIDYLYSFITK